MITAFLLCLILISCKSSDLGTDLKAPQESNDLLIINANIYTVNPTKPWAEAMWISEGLIRSIGSTVEVISDAPEDMETFDLKGAFIMPGIHDVHMHPLEASSSNFHFTISDEVDDPEDYLDDIIVASEVNAGDDWLLGWGHYIHTVLNGERHPIEILDEVSNSRPIAIMEQTSHSLWVNNKALEVLEFTKETEDPEGGIIMRDDNGNPIGILIDNAGNVLLNQVLAASFERSQNDYESLIEFGLPELSRHGITSICDARTYWKRDHHKVWQRLNEEQLLTVRVNLGLWAYPTEGDDIQLRTLKSLYHHDPNSLLRINQVKVYIDGVIPNTTAALHEPYSIDLFHLDHNNGLNYFTEGRLTRYIGELESVGFDFHIHAIGDRGVHEALNAIENGGSKNGRHRITHVELLDRDDADRFQELNVTADCQIAGDFTQPGQWIENEPFIGTSRASSFVPIRDLVDAGARLTLSSDWDVSTLNPFVGIQNAVTRSPQNISLEKATEAYTINAAYVMRQEDIVGSLEEGKEADFIILDRNIFEVDPYKISKSKVEATYLKGELIFQR